MNTKRYSGTIKAPASKSYMQRAIAIAILAEGSTCISNPSFCNDSRAVLNVAEDLGAEVFISEEEVCIVPGDKIKKRDLNLGESGLGIRMMTPLVALYPESFTLHGEGSLCKRPLSMLEGPLRDLSVQIKTQGGLLPIEIQGPMLGGDIQLDGSLSSQTLTGLLIALPKTKKSSRLEVSDLKSRPYIDMTLEIMAHFGVQVQHEDYQLFEIEGGQSYQGTGYQVEGDWSGAAFHLVGGAIAGDVTLLGLNPHSCQADRKILDAIRSAGAEIHIDKNQVRVIRKELKAFEFDARHCPDLFPPLSNLAVACEGISVIKGVSRLIHKESDRATAIQEEWGKLGVDIEIRGDEMHIQGSTVSGGEIHSHRDHRIAMMGAIASLISTGEVLIHEAEAVNKSYPDFFKDYDELIES